MKLIGMELRVGVGGGFQVLEAKLVPVEIVIPSAGYSGRPEAEVTFHCDRGDVTTPRIQLPAGWENEFNNDPQGAHNWLEKYLQSVRL